MANVILADDDRDSGADFGNSTDSIFEIWFEKIPGRHIIKNNLVLQARLRM